MKSVTVNAGFFLAASLTASTEETRYYLNGVFMEPHPSGRGVLLISTDGHRLVSVYDEAATFEGDAGIIINLPPALLKECKAKRDLRLLQITNGVPAILSVNRETAEESGYAAAIEAHDATRVAVAPGACLVDGTFPDWRRVVPKSVETCTPHSVAFNPTLLAEFAKVVAALMNAKGIATSRGGGAVHAMSVAAPDATGPALVRWADTPYAFGVIMPMRFSEPLGDLPAYMQPAEEAPAEKVAA